MQANKRLGRHSVFISGDVKIIGAYTIAGKKEGEGPIGEAFDLIMEDGHWGEESWEKSEIKMQREAITKAAHKANKPLGEINLIYSGDLQNQCVSSSFGARELEVPIYGLFGACSTMAESLSLGAMAIDGVCGKCNLRNKQPLCLCRAAVSFPWNMADKGRPPPSGR